MRICITNDDGIHGEGLLVLANWAEKLGEVTIFAPKEQQSGKGHSIELHQRLGQCHSFLREARTFPCRYNSELHVNLLLSGPTSTYHYRHAFRNIACEADGHESVSR